MLELIIERRKAAEDMAERMKQYNQLVWVEVVNSIRNELRKVFSKK